jgi:hypothetical protein
MSAPESPGTRAASRSRPSGESAQVFPEGAPIDCWRELLNALVRLLPDGKRTGQESASLFSENEDAATAVVGIALDSKEASALEWFQCGSQSCAIHGEQGCDGSHRGRLRAVEGHEERELTVGEFEGTKFFIETPGKSTSCALHMQAKTAVFDHQCCFERQLFST